MLRAALAPLNVREQQPDPPPRQRANVGKVGRRLCFTLEDILTSPLLLLLRRISYSQNQSPLGEVHELRVCNSAKYPLTLRMAIAGVSQATCR